MKKMFSLALAFVLTLSLAVPTLAYGNMGKVGENNVVSGGRCYTGFIDENGALWTWGDNEYGKLGNGSTKESSTPVKVLDNNVAAVSCGNSHTAAIKTDGSLWMWGGNGGSNVPVKVLDNVSAVSCGGGHTAALKTDGSVWTWGLNNYGQLGNGGGGNATNSSRETIQTVPVKVLDGVAAVSCGQLHTAAIKTDGSLWTWGANAYGTLGNGARVGSSTPVKVMDGVAVVSCGSSYTTVVKTDGSLWTWGGNGFGELGYKGGNGDFLGYLIQTVPKQVAGLTTSVSPSLPSASTTTPVTAAPEFSDVKATAYYADAVKWAIEKNITAGTSASTFSPNRVCSKAEILTFLWRSQGKPEPTISAPYSNLSPSDYYYKAALWACETGVVSSGDFGRECTRSSAVTYLWILAGRPSAPVVNFNDVPKNADYAQAVAWAVQQGITSGTSKTTFSPEATCTRGQIATFLYRAYGK